MRSAQASAAAVAACGGVLCALLLTAVALGPRPRLARPVPPARVRGPSATRQGRRDVIKAGTVMVPLTAGGLAGRRSLAEDSGKLAPDRFEIPAMGIGAWAWGDSLFWQYDKKNDADLAEVFNYCMDNGVDFFDTAEIYGFGRSEKLLGEFDKEYQKKPTYIASKFAPLPWRGNREAVVKACKQSLERLGRDKLDLYQIHFPASSHNKDFWDGLGDCYEKGLVKAVGVSNYGVEALTRVKQELDQRGIPLSSNQIQYSLLYRFPEENGLKKACDDMGVKILAYSPLCLGLLTGKYTKDKLPKGPRALIAKKLLADPEYTNLLNTMQSVAETKDATKPQIALAWCIAKGTCPIPGARNLRQAKENVAALKLKLSQTEIDLLDDAARKVGNALSPDTTPFTKYDKELGIRMYQS